MSCSAGMQRAALHLSARAPRYIPVFLPLSPLGLGTIVTLARLRGYDTVTSGGMTSRCRGELRLRREMCRLVTFWYNIDCYCYMLH